MSKTKIEWTEQTWNPIIGCSKVSEGCRNCYAEKMALRLAGIERNKAIKANADPYKTPYNQVVLCHAWYGKTAFVESALKKPMRRKKATTYFVCSMGDLFHESVQDDWIDQVFAVMALCPQHTFQVLTKRPKRMAEYIATRIEFPRVDIRQKTFPLANVWLGVTCENQQTADERIPHLLRCPAARRFVSVEPMLEKINLKFLWRNDLYRRDSLGRPLPLREIDWVICGAETGGGKRAMNPLWADDLYSQCQEAGVAFFGKKDSRGWELRVKHRDVLNAGFRRLVREFPKS